MAVEFGYSTEYQEQFPSFGREVPTEPEIEQMCGAYEQNRAILQAHAEEWGLNPAIFDNRKVVIGPFIHPSPIPTIYAGKLGNYRIAQEVGNCYARVFESKGYAPVMPELAMLGMKGFQERGYSSSAFFTLPKNVGENEAVGVGAKGFHERPFQEVALSPEKVDLLLKRIDTQRTVYKERVPVKKADMDGILDMAKADIRVARENSGMNLVQFMAEYNTRLAQRMGMENARIGIYAVDTNEYTAFMNEGLVDEDQFVRILSQLGYFNTADSYIRTGSQTEKGAQFQSISCVVEGNEVAYYDIKSKERVDKDAVRSAQYRLPSKELAYFLNFSSLVPTVYGCGNNEHEPEDGTLPYYHSYAMARAQVERAGLQPIFYRIQPSVPDYCQDPSQFGTLYDFYHGILRKDETR